MTTWAVVGGGTAGCVVAANLAAGRPDDAVTLVESGPVLGGASLVNGGLVVGDHTAYQHRLPLEPPADAGTLGAALAAADPLAATVLLARRGGQRVTVAEAYLAEPPANLTVATGVDVVRIAMLGRRPEGIVTSHGDVPAERVVLCAGAVGSPLLLLRSGVSAPGLGQGLQNHLGVAVAADIADATASADLDVSVTAEHGDHQMLAIEPSRAMGGYAAIVAGWLAVRSTGSVTLGEPDGPATVDVGRLGHPLDRAGLVTTLAALRQVIDHPSVRAVADEFYVDEAGTTFDALIAEGDAGIWAWAERAPNPYHHLAGSCRLGITVEPGGRVRGYDGLAVCDASVLPGVPPRNTYLAVIDLAERLSAGWARA